MTKTELKKAHTDEIAIKLAELEKNVITNRRSFTFDDEKVYRTFLEENVILKGDIVNVDGDAVTVKKIYKQYVFFMTKNRFFHGIVFDDTEGKTLMSVKVEERK